MIRSSWLAFLLILSITMPVIAQESRRGSVRFSRRTTPKGRIDAALPEGR